MPSQVIENLLKAAGGDLYRPNLFNVEILVPMGSKLGSSGVQIPSEQVNGVAGEFSVLCTATQIPEARLESTTVPWLGRELYYPSDRKMPNWSVTVIEGRDLYYHKQFHTWQNLINSFEGNRSTARRMKDYTANAICYLLDRAANYPKSPRASTALEKFAVSLPPPPNSDISNTVTGKFEINMIWPVSVGAVDLSFDANDQTVAFTVEFAVCGYVGPLR